MQQIKLFLRIVFRGKEVYLLKFVTLAIVFSSSTVVILFALNEFGYDHFHREYQKIFRVLQRTNAHEYSGNRLSTKIPTSVFTALKTISEDSVISSRVKSLQELKVVAGGETYYNQGFRAADFNITKIFSLEIIDGSLTEFLNSSTVIVSEECALRYFKSVHASGKEIKIFTFSDTLNFSISAVYKDFPQNSHEKFTGFIPFNNQEIRSLNFDPEDTGIYAKVFGGETANWENFLSGFIRNDNFSYQFQPISEIYFGPTVLGEDVRHGDRYSIFILLSLSLLLFFLAIASFINLTTLTLPHRAKELAVKKLSGTSQLHLNTSLLKESFLLTSSSAVVSILLLFVVARWLKPILLMDITSKLLEFDGMTLIILFLLVTVVALAPILMIAKFTKASPNRLLSADVITFPRLKQTITVLQLGISIFLIVASIVIRRQINYSLLKEPGRNHQQIVYLNYPPDLNDVQLNNLRNGWRKNKANIIDLIGTSQLPNQISSKELNSPFYSISVNPTFNEFFNLEIFEGSWFSANDGDSIIVVNEYGKKWLDGNYKNVAGVFKGIGGQFNQPDKPLKIKLSSYHDYNFLCIKILEVDIRKTIRFLSNFFGNGEQEIKISFADRSYEEWLNYQDRLNKLSNILAIIALALSCFSIYGLSISMVKDKLKDIALHKLFGASTAKVTRILIFNFVTQMMIAILIFAPLTYIILTELLRNFVYATHLNWLDGLFPLAYCILVISMLCGMQALSLSRRDLSSALKG